MHINIPEADFLLQFFIFFCFPGKSFATMKVETRYKEVEEKVVVLSTPLAKRVEPYVLQIPGCKKIKTVKNNTFFWFDNGKTNMENMDEIKKAIAKAPGGAAMIFKVYPIYKGRVDMDFQKPNSWKDTQAYYTSGKKDITEAELSAFA